MLHTSSSRRRRILVALLVLSAAVGTGVPALGQDGLTDGGEETTSTSSTTSSSTTTTTTPSTSSSSTTLDPNDLGVGEDLDPEAVPEDPGAIPPRVPDPGAYADEAGRLLRQSLEVAQAESVQLDTSYADARQRTIDLERRLDRLERSVTNLAFTDRAAVRRIEAARRHFEARAVNATIRGSLEDFRPAGTGDPNDLAIAGTLLGSVLEADQSALADYLAARDAVDADLVSTADDLVEARNELVAARAALVEARRANVSAKINLAIYAAGSDIVIQGFVFPVGQPHTFGDSWGAPRMMGTSYEHAHKGTDIMAPMGTPLLACERGVITKMGNDSLGGTKLWLKGESGTFYYYAHLSAFAEGMVNGLVVEAGHVIGYVGDSGNARGGAPHLHFQIHPDGGAAVNPYPLLKVVSQLSQQAQQDQQAQAQAQAQQLGQQPAGE